MDAQQIERYTQARVATRYWKNDPFLTGELLADFKAQTLAGVDSVFETLAELHTAVRDLTNEKVVCLILHPEELPRLESLGIALPFVLEAHALAWAMPNEAYTEEAKAMKALVEYTRFKNQKAVFTHL